MEYCMLQQFSYFQHTMGVMMTIECDCGGRVYVLRKVDKNFKESYVCKCSNCGKTGKVKNTPELAKKGWGQC